MTVNCMATRNEETRAHIFGRRKVTKAVSGREVADLENSGFPQVICIICIVSTTLYKSLAFCREKSLHCGNPALNQEKTDMHNCFAKVKHYLRQNDLALQLTLDPNPLITPPTRRVWRSFKFAPFLFFSRVESWATAHG